MSSQDENISQEEVASRVAALPLGSMGPDHDAPSFDWRDVGEFFVALGKLSRLRGMMRQEDGLDWCEPEDVGWFLELLDRGPEPRQGSALRWLLDQHERFDGDLWTPALLREVQSRGETLIDEAERRLIDFGEALAIEGGVLWLELALAEAGPPPPPQTAS